MTRTSEVTASRDGARVIEMMGVEIYMVEGDLDLGPGEGGAVVIYIDTVPADAHIRIRLNDTLIAEGDPESTTFTVGEDLEL